MHRQKLAIKAISLILLFVMAIGLTPAESLASPQAADHQPEAPGTITFEEAIPTPENVLSQYCNNATTNKGVSFLNNYRIFQPSVLTASGTHALTTNFPGSEFYEYHKVSVKFTTGQSSVGVKVGLDRKQNFAVTAYLRAYNTETPGNPNNLVVQSTLLLGYGPLPITQNLQVSSTTANIRSIELEFLGPTIGYAAHEVLDDLTFSTIGPPCVNDTANPTVQIAQPATDGLLVQVPTLDLEYTANDSQTGIAKIQVLFLDSTGSEVGSFYECGGTGPACIYLSYPYTVHSHYQTYMPSGTQKIRVKAWDFANHVGQADRTINFTPPGPNMNLWALAMEVTQATQPWVPSSETSRSSSTPSFTPTGTAAPLVFGKRTVVRVYPGIEGTGSTPLLNAQAALTCRNQYGDACSGPASIQPTQNITVSPAFNNNINTLREDPSRTWNFVLPEAWTTPSAGIWRVFTAKVSPPAYVAECSGCDDGANSITISGLGFGQTAPLDLHVVWACVRRHITDTVTTCDHAPLTIHQPVFQAVGSLFPEMMPVRASDVQVTLRSPQQVAFDGQFLLHDGAMTSDRMSAFHGLMYQLIKQDTGQDSSQHPINFIYFGIVPPPVTAWLGLGNRNAAIAKIATGSLYGDTETAAEEVGHALGRPHESCDHDEGGCEPAPSVFPCAHGGICTYGLNTGKMEVISPGSPTGIHAHDFMSYGGDAQWVSPYTWGKIYDVLHGALAAQTPEGQTPQQPAQAEPALWVSGWVSGTGATETAQLTPFYQLQQEGVSHQAGTGAYSLELQDSSGAVLFTRYFDPQVTTGDPPDPSYPPPGRFSDILPYNANTARVVLKHGSQVLAQRVRSLSAPTVAILSPTALDNWQADGYHTISWSGSDPDRSALYYLIQYSPDGGATWSTLASDWTQSSLQVDSTYLAGSDNARVRVLASDGFNTTIALSPSFRVSTKAPLVWFTNPVAQGDTVPSYAQGAMVALEGNGTDWEDGPLPSSALSWRADRVIPLGTGRRLDLSTLSPGRHWISLIAQDRDGQTSSTSMSIEVVARLNTQPVAEAGPDLTVGVGGTVLLDGTASSDADSDPLTYLWTVITQPVGSQVTLSTPNAVQTDFGANTAGDYVVELVVSDGRLSSLPDRVVVHVTGTGGGRGYRFYVSPATRTVGVSQQVTVELRVDSIENLYGVQVEMAFDPTIVQVVDVYPTVSGVQIEEGSFPVPDVSQRNQVDNVNGRIEYIASLQGAKPGVSGSGTVARIILRGLRAGVSRLSFTRVVLSDPHSVQLYTRNQGGQITIEQNAATLAGRAILERRTSSAGAQVCLGNTCATTSYDGVYIFPNIAPGTYTATVSSPAYLRSQRMIQATGGLLSLPEVTLLAGDVNGDDRIHLVDKTLEGLAWNGAPGTPQWDVRADINADSTVNILDLVAVEYNWNATAPGPWSGTMAAQAAAGEKAPTTRRPCPESPEKPFIAQVAITPSVTTLDFLTQTATVDIVVNEVQDLYAAWVQITFDPTILRVRDADPRPSAPGVQIIPGDFLDPLNQSVGPNRADNTSGTIEFAVTQTYPATAKSGSGMLVRIEFEVVGRGASPVHLAGVQLLDDTRPDPQEILTGISDGQVVIEVHTLFLPMIMRGGQQ